MESFLIAVNAVVPFLTYISFGYLVRVIGFADEVFLKKLNQMVFKVFFPIIMFYNVYHKDAGTFLNGRLVITGVFSVLFLIGILFFVVPMFEKQNAKRGVIIQALYRSNFVLFALPLTQSIFGEQGSAVASMMIAVIIPIYNVSAILILEYFRGGQVSPFVLLKKVLTNPMILGTLVGFLFLACHITLPHCIEVPVAQFANMTTPLALFILGGTLHFSDVRKNAGYLIITLTLKLIVFPAVILGVSVLLQMDALSRFVLFTMYATPVATASYSMASNMGGDGDLAGEYVVVSTAVSVITIFFWIFFMKSNGLI